jgi:hypothetical protein
MWLESQPCVLTGLRTGLLDPPELAQEITRLESLLDKWEDLDFCGIEDKVVTKQFAQYILTILA